jgi:hypothetical protein
MSFSATAADRAMALVEEVRDDPGERLELCARIYNGPTGKSHRHVRFRRAALSFMRWQVSRGVLAPLDAEVPGSRWWRAVNERLLRDGCEMVARSAGLGGAPSSATIELWMTFLAEPTARTWYRAHNASIVAAYLDHTDLAEQEGAVERFFLNVVLLRVLYAHSLVAAPRLSLGRFAPLGGLLGDPRLGMAGAFLSMSRILPERYPVIDDLRTYVEKENNLGRLLDYGVILPRLELRLSVSPLSWTGCVKESRAISLQSRRSRFGGRPRPRSWCACLRVSPGLCHVCVRSPRSRWRRPCGARISSRPVSRVIQLSIWLRSASEICATTVEMSWIAPRAESRSRSPALARWSPSCERYRPQHLQRRC